MTPAELEEWLRTNADDIFGFTHYEIDLSSDADLHSVLSESWFRDEAWNEPGYRFVHLGQDGTGGLVALWLRPGVDGPPPVVFFGSEGGCGVLAASPEAWAKILAHGPMIVEYAEMDTAGQVVPGGEGGAGDAPHHVVFPTDWTRDAPHHVVICPTDWTG